MFWWHINIILHKLIKALSNLTNTKQTKQNKNMQTNKQAENKNKIKVPNRNLTKLFPVKILHKWKLKKKNQKKNKTRVINSIQEINKVVQMCNIWGNFLI
jgi:hypothetical protein